MKCNGANVIRNIWLAVFLVIINQLLVFAENIKTTIGFKSNYSSGISDTNIIYKPFCKIGYEINIFKVEATGTYTINQQITDGMGNFTEINTGQGHVKTVLMIGDIIELGGGYTLGCGQNSYTSKMYTINGSIYIGDITLDLDYSKENKNYEYTSEIDIINHSFSGSLSYDANDFLGYEIEYHYMANNFSNLGYTYFKNNARVGVSVYADTSIYMIGGIIGKDSGDYMIYGCDVAMSKKIYDVLKCMILYTVDYYNAPYVTTMSGGGHGGNNGGGYKGMNPYIRSDLAGKSFFAHSLSASLSCSF